MVLAQQQTSTLPMKNTCSAFCPVCGTDLYYSDNECVCKNKECSWICSECSKSSKSE